MEIYVVQPGDDVDAIAARYDIAVQDLIWANQIDYPYRLAVGQALLILKEPDVQDKRSRERPRLCSFGYAYPFITRQILEDTLPFLTDLHIFSYGFTAEGRLVFPASDDTWVIATAEQAGVRPILTLTPMGADGNFNNALVTALVHDQRVQQRLLLGLLKVMEEKRYQGLDIDFEYLNDIIGLSKGILGKQGILLSPIFSFQQVFYTCQIM